MYNISLKRSPGVYFPQGSLKPGISTRSGVYLRLVLINISTIAALLPQCLPLLHCVHNDYDREECIQGYSLRPRKCTQHENPDAHREITFNPACATPINIELMGCRFLGLYSSCCFYRSQLKLDVTAPSLFCHPISNAQLEAIQTHNWKQTHGIWAWHPGI